MIDGFNSLVMERSAWRKLAGELHVLSVTLQRLRSGNPDQRRLGLVCLSGAEAEMVMSFSRCAAMVSEAPDEVMPMALA